LSRLATGPLELTDVLTRVAEFAAAAIPGADGAGLTLLEHGHADTIVASAPFVAEVDGIQYGIREGRCITAAAQGRTVRSGELGSDAHWPASVRGPCRSACIACCRYRSSPARVCSAR
jgi:hypothetical protein